MLNEQLARMTLYSHIDQPGLSWRTGGTEITENTITKGDPFDLSRELPGQIKNDLLTPLCVSVVTNPS